MPARPRAHRTPPGLLGSAFGSAAGRAPHLRTHPGLGTSPGSGARSSPRRGSNPSLVTLSKPLPLPGLHPFTCKMGGLDVVSKDPSRVPFRLYILTSPGHQPVLLLADPLHPGQREQEEGRLLGPGVGHAPRGDQAALRVAGAPGHSREAEGGGRGGGAGVEEGPDTTSGRGHEAVAKGRRDGTEQSGRGPQPAHRGCSAGQRTGTQQADGGTNRVEGRRQEEGWRETQLRVTRGRHVSKAPV